MYHSETSIQPLGLHNSFFSLCEQQRRKHIQNQEIANTENHTKKRLAIHKRPTKTSNRNKGSKKKTTELTWNHRKTSKQKKPNHIAHPARYLELLPCHFMDFSFNRVKLYFVCVITQSAIPNFTKSINSMHMVAHS